MKKSLVASILFGTLAVSSSAKDLTLLFENEDSFPWSTKAGGGVDIILLKMVDKALPDVSFKYEAVPWKRCLMGMKAGAADGCFSASYKGKRKEFGHYPEAGGSGDQSKMLHTASYSLYAVAADASKFKVNKFDVAGLAKGSDVIAGPQGYSITDDLAKAGHKVDSSGKSTLLNFRKLLAGRVKLVAALTLNGDALSNSAEFKGKIVKLSPAMVSKPYYLMLGKSVDAATRKKIWDKIAEIREDAGYKAKAAAFIQSK